MPEDKINFALHAATCNNNSNSERGTTTATGEKEEQQIRQISARRCSKYWKQNPCWANVQFLCICGRTKSGKEEKEAGGGETEIVAACVGGKVLQGVAA